MKILVVDHEEGLRQELSRLLRGEGHEVDAAATVEQAVALFSAGYDVVILDIEMPGPLGSFELVRRARAASWGADLLLLTARPDFETAVQALKEGAQDFLQKPLQMDQLLKAVRRSGEKRHLSQELARERALRRDLDRALKEAATLGKVREVFGHFADPEIVSQLLEDPDAFCARAERREVTVLFADVRGFVSFASRIAPEEAVGALNEIFDRLIEAVRLEKGILNKFLGDGVMAFFGAPLPLPDHPRRAAHAALMALQSIEDLAKFRTRKGLIPLHVGIALNTGEVLAGCLGSRLRTEYSIIGHAVNLASRLEGVAGPGEILVGPETANYLRGEFLLGESESITLAGVAEPIQPSVLKGWKPKRRRP